MLNLHQQSGREEIRQKTSIEFLRSSELEEPLEPLFVRAPFVMVSLEGKPLPFGVPDTAASQLHQDASCLPGEDATGTKQNVYVDRFGRSFSGHFVVPPGRHEYRTLATGQLKLQYDTTIHYIAAHLHPFAEYVELRDLTTGQTVHRANAHNLDSGIGLREVEFFSSREGLPLYRDHEYEVVVVYDNTSGQKQDGMAVLFLYLHNKAFTPPPAPAQAVAPPAGFEPAT